jgi:general secretion pathway protein A
MYTHFFRLARPPFSISPDPRYLFMSQSHHEALAHLMYGAGGGGGVVVLTGEIGAGKTTVCRCFLDQVPDNCNVGYIFNPKLTVQELLQAICEEFHIEVAHGDMRAGVKDYIDALNRFLLDAYAQGRNSMLIIDEAQNLAVDVLEQLRLLTNLETNERKLLQIVLIGQPELRHILARPELEQLAQRVIARYHLGALTEQETASYIQHRLSTSGLNSVSPFQQPQMKLIHQITHGVPRRINLLCDRALLGAYSLGRHNVDSGIIRTAARELFADDGKQRPQRRHVALAAIAAVLAASTVAWTMAGGRWPSMARLSAPAPHGDTHTTAATVAPQAPAPVSAPEPAPMQVMSEQDGRPRSALQGEEEGVRQLARAWGITLEEGLDPCVAAKSKDLRCYRSENGLAELRQLDRPAVVKLHDKEWHGYYALLTGIRDATATLRAGDVTQTVALSTLVRHFHGDFVTLWRAPQQFGDPLHKGDKGPQVDAVAKLLAKIYGGKEPAAGEPLNAKMIRQVQDFQQSQGLYVDGIAGPVTLMHLNRVAGVEEPSLLGDTKAPVFIAHGEE